MITSRQQRWIMMASVLLLMAFLSSALGLSANLLGSGGTIVTVTSGADVVADDGVCTLREAINATNNNAPSGTQPGECPAGSPVPWELDEIHFTPSIITYTLAITGAQENENASGDLDVEGALRILGNGITQTVITANQLDRVFHVQPSTADLTLEDLAVTGGLTPDADVSETVDPGGGIYNESVLYLYNVALYGNQTGMGYPLQGPPGGPGGNGGGVASTWTLVINSSSIYSNTTGMGGMSEPSGTSGAGGGIYSSGTVSVFNSQLYNNVASEGNWGVDRGGDGGDGGAIAIAGGEATIYTSTLTNNSAGMGGYGFSPGIATGGDGGSGGGIYAAPNTEIIIRASQISNNSSGFGGTGTGGAPADAGDGGHGGGIFGDATSRIFIDNSAIFDNEAGGAGVAPAGLPGNGAGIFSNGELTVQGSTISGNALLDGPSGVGAGQGGGIRADNATIRNSTIAFNISPLQPGAGIFGNNNNLGNTILANNDAPTSPDCRGTLSSVGHLLIQDFDGTLCGIAGTTGTNIYGQDPQLLPLALNGGLTQNHALNTNSPAIDAGNCFDIAADQRGLPRPIDNPAFPNVSDACDIGAYEGQDGVPGPTRTPSSTATATPTAPSAPTMTATATATTSPSATPTVLPTSTATATTTAPATPSATATVSVTPSATVTPSVTPSTTETPPLLYLPLIFEQAGAQ